MDSYRSNEHQTTNSFVTQTKAINLTVYRVVVAPVGFVVTVPYTITALWNGIMHQRTNFEGRPRFAACSVDINLCQYGYEKFHNREMR